MALPRDRITYRGGERGIYLSPARPGCGHMAAAAVEHRTYGSESSMYVRSTRRVNGVALLAIVSPY